MWQPLAATYVPERADVCEMGGVGLRPDLFRRHTPERMNIGLNKNIENNFLVWHDNPLMKKGQLALIVI